jgi:hypothetical protein
MRDNLKKGIRGQHSKNGYFWHLVNTSVDILSKFTLTFNKVASLYVHWVESRIVR